MACLLKVLSFFTLFLSLVLATQPNHNVIKRQSVDITPIHEITPKTGPGARIQAIQPLNSEYLIALKDKTKYQPILLAQIKNATGLDATLKRDLSGGKLFNGVVVNLSSHSDSESVVVKISKLAGVVAVTPNAELTPPDSNFNVTQIFDRTDIISEKEGQLRVKAAVNQIWSIDQLMVQGDKLRAKGFTGKGIKVAVMDGEADLSHPEINIAYTRDFRNAADIPDADKNCGSHALACASIISTKPSIAGAWGGLAPDVEVGNYIISSCKSGGTVDRLMRALEQAALDNVQIVSMSLGWGDNWAFSNFASDMRLFDKLDAQGMLLVVSAGNVNDPFYKNGASCAYSSVFCVGAVENPNEVQWIYSSKWTASGGTSGIMRWRNGELEPRNENDGRNTWVGVNLPLWINNGSDPAGGCAAYPSNRPDLSKYIVLARRNGCSDYDIIAKAEAAGAKYVIVTDKPENSQGDRIEVPRAPAPNVTAAAFMPASEAAELLALWLKGQKIVLNMGAAIQNNYWSRKKTDDSTYGPRGGKMISWSAWGPSFDAAATVDIAAPGSGVPILSPYNKYGVADGTSMSTPIVVAGMALVAQALGTTDMHLVASALVSTTKKLDRDGKTNPGYATIASQGGGMAQFDQAASVQAIISTRNLEFNQTNARTTKSFEIVNLKNKAMTFKLSNLPAGTIYTFPSDSFQPGNWNQIRSSLYETQSANASLTFSGGNTVTVPAKGKTTIKVTASEPASANATRLPVWSGFIKAETTDGYNITVPYMGIKGDLDRAPKVVKVDIEPVGVRSFTFPTDEVVCVWTVGLGSRSVNTYVHHAGNGTRVGSAAIWELGTRANGKWGAGWRGKLPMNAGNITSGQYFLRTEALRGFLDRNANGSTSFRPEDVLITDSDKFTVSWS